MSNGAGKGSRPRPCDREKYNEGYDRIWKGKKMRYFCHDCHTHFDSPVIRGAFVGFGVIEVDTCPNCKNRFIIKGSDDDKNRNDIPRQREDRQ